MLGRNTYTPQELESARTAIADQLADYRALAAAVAGTDAEAALAAFKPRLCSNMTIVLDRYFVHRVRSVTGKDGNPLNEVELLTESLMNHDGVLQAGTVFTLDPVTSVVKLAPGDRIGLTAADLDRLATAYLDEIDRRCVQAG
jgi:2-keto-4-pentenoate hydratase